MTSQQIPRLELDRVILRPLTLDDVEDVFEAYSDKEAMKYRENPPLKTMKDATEMIEQTWSLAKSGTSIRWGIEEKASGRIIGTFVWKIEKRGASGEIGYSLHRNWWGKGLMLEVLQFMVGYLFEKEGLTLLRARVHRDNVASMRLLGKAGFTKTTQGIEPKLVFEKRPGS